MEGKFPNFVVPEGSIIDHDDPMLLLRETGLVEKLCKHGVGHPVGHVKAWNPTWMGVHGCDGCCYKAEFYLENI